MTVQKGVLDVVSIAPHSDVKVKFKLQIPHTGKIYLKLRYTVEKGNFIA